jgi:DNA-binding CsgD family transcriptional regulator
MPRLAELDVRWLRDVERQLAVYVDGSGPILERMADTLREGLGAKTLLAYAVAPRGEGLRLEWFHGANLPKPGMARALDAWLADKTVAWTSYNCSYPEPWQRNRPVTLDEIRVRMGPIERLPLTAFMRRWGLWPGVEQLRVLVCEGSCLLGFLGAYQPEPFTARQRRLLARLVPPLRRRLWLERALSVHSTVEASLGAAMEEVGASAMIVDEQGGILHANSAGASTLALDRTTARAAIRAALGARTLRDRACAQFRVTPIRATGTAARFLVVAREERNAIEARAASIATRWGLSARQRDVLALVVRGESNRAIACRLGVSERTVETHVTALLQKAQVASRSALVGCVLAA